MTEAGPITSAREQWVQAMLQVCAVVDLYLKPGGQTQHYWTRIVELSERERAAFKAYQLMAKQ